MYVRSRAIALVGTLIVATGILSSVARAEEEQPKVDVDVSKGGLTVSSGETTFHLGGYAHVLYTGADRELYDADDAGTGLGAEDGYSSSFAVRRARLELKGTMFRSWLKYAITYELADTAGDNDSKFKDVYLNFARYEAASIYAGQYKVPFSMQELTSDTRQQFVDRSITNLYAPARDQGVAVTGLFLEKKLGYAAGVFNGGGETRRQDDQGLMYVGRIWYDPLGEFKLSEGTVDASDEHDLHFGMAYRTGEVARGTLTADIFENPNDQSAWNLEAAWRWKRLAATAEYFQQTNEFSNPTVGPDVDQTGWHAQFAFAAIPKKLELGVRYALLDGNTDLADAKTSETRFGINYYIVKNNLKLQADFAQFDYDPNGLLRGSSRLPEATGQDLTDRVVRVQAQLAF